jgi:hypothetical protein
MMENTVDGSETRPVATTRHGEWAGAAPSEAVVRALAVAGVDLTEGEPVLYEVIDLEAVDDVFAGDRDGVSVRFEYDAHEIRIDDDGRVRVFVTG